MREQGIIRTIIIIFLVRRNDQYFMELQLLMNNIRFPHINLKLCVLILMFCLSFASNAKLEKQQQDFLTAKEYLNKGKFKEFYNIRDKLKDYVLYPYLEYEFLRKRLHKIKNVDVIEFLNRNNDLPMIGQLRRQWYQQLISRNEWQTFLDNYEHQSSLEIQCNYLLAQQKTGNNTSLLEDTRAIWLHGRSLPSNCDPLFKKLYDSKLMTSELAYQRVRLAMENKKSGLAKYLGKFLNRQDKQWLDKWLATHANPEKYTNNAKWQDNEKAREILAYGIQRLGKKDIEKSVSRWQTIKANYNFDELTIGKVQKQLALYAASKDSKLAKNLLSDLPNTLVDKSIFRYQLRTALKNQDWQTLLKWTKGEAPSDAWLQQWQYWRARALMETGHATEANAILKRLAKERDYYGFLAADRLGIEYSMNHASLPEDDAEIKNIMRMPAMQRTYEFYQMDLITESNREWHHLLNNLTKYQIQIAAEIAFDWGWYNRAIAAVGKAKAYDDLDIRFPVLHKDLLHKYASKNSLDASWMTALIRAESAFKEDARSPAGALGLMQVMPRTGKETARKIGIKGFKSKHLLNAKTNIPIGSAYLKNMENNFKGNKILATAAYNAGPHRVVKWLPDAGCHEPDVWIELIPFKETHSYVRRVLFYANIYDWKYNNGITRISDRMKTITPKGEISQTGLSCNASLISQQ